MKLKAKSLSRKIPLILLDGRMRAWYNRVSGLDQPAYEVIPCSSAYKEKARHPPGQRVTPENSLHYGLHTLQAS